MSIFSLWYHLSMITVFREHFPATKSRFMVYFKLFYPMLIGSTLYALNGFIDNFMVGHINQGGTALSAVNSWTNIIIGFFIGIGAAGSVINAKYYFSGDFERAQSLFKFRLIFSISISILFGIIAWSTPDTLIKIFLKEPSGTNANFETYNNALHNAREYQKIIAISWVLIAITSQMGNSLSEIGHGKSSMYWGYMTIVTNVALNATLMYGLNFGVEGAAYASVAARIVAALFGIYWLLTKDTKISFKIWTLFKFDLVVVKDFLTKWYLFIAFSSVTLFITFRNFFYDAGYPTGSNTLGVGVGAMSVLALTGAIMNIFITTFSASGSMAANTVGKELSQGHIHKAKKVAKELKGFITLMALILASILAIFAIAVPYMEFLSEKKWESTNGVWKLVFDNKANLLQVRNSLWVVCLFYPMWIWFTVSYRSAATGKKSLGFSIIDIVVSGPVQLSWIAAIAYGIIPNSDFMLQNFWVSYALFFTSDFILLIGMELLFYKTKWNTPITTKELKAVKAWGADEITESQINGK